MPAKGLLPALLAGVSAMPANGLAEPPPPSLARKRRTQA